MNSDFNRLFLFLDESGSIDNNLQTKYFQLTVLVSTNPIVDRDKFLKLKYDILSRGFEIECFHATYDKPITRLEFLNIVKDLNDFKIYSVYIDKSKLPNTLKDYHKVYVYKNMYEQLLTQTFEHIKEERQQEYLDSCLSLCGKLFTKSKHDFILKAVKPVLKTNFQLSFEQAFVTTSSDINCQIADYCSWALYNKLSEGKTYLYEFVEDKFVFNRELEVMESLWTK